MTRVLLAAQLFALVVLSLARTGHAEVPDLRRPLRLKQIEPLPEIKIDGKPVKIHTQGLKVTARYYLVTGRLETDPKRALLLRFPRRELTKFELTDITPDQDPNLDHPGGFDRDGAGVYWIPVSTSNPRGPTIIYGLVISDQQPLSAVRRHKTIRIEDHIGAIACLDSGTLLAANWDTKTIYWIDEQGTVTKELARNKFIARNPGWQLAVQDWKFDRKHGFLRAGGIDKSPRRTNNTPNAMVAVIDLKRQSIVDSIPFAPRAEVARPMTNEGMDWFADELFLLPEDFGEGARVFRFERKKGEPSAQPIELNP